MGAPYTILDHIQLDCDSATDIVVEIGSENGEGSSRWLYQWSSNRDVKFYSIDVEHSEREISYPEIPWVVSESGSLWCKNILPTLNKAIKVLYLDNFDYMYNTNNPSVLEQYARQVTLYAQRGVVMNNQNCMEEHRLQVEYCLPYMAEQSVIIMDDTYYDPALEFQPANELPQWYGKCATAMPLMIEAGYSIIRDQEHNINYAIKSR